MARKGLSLQLTALQPDLGPLQVDRPLLFGQDEAHLQLVRCPRQRRPGHTARTVDDARLVPLVALGLGVVRALIQGDVIRKVTVIGP